ncbi:hypothetical protein DBR06_SOUSAS8510047, partial [Sousa chinensis]
IPEVYGFALCEWCTRGTVKVSKDKWALKFMRKRVGTHIRA